MEKGIQTPMAQGRSTKIVWMIKWIRTSRSSIKNFLSLPRIMAREKEAKSSEDGCFRLQDLGFRVQGAGFRVQGSGCRVPCAGFRVQGYPAEKDVSHERVVPRLQIVWRVERESCRERVLYSPPTGPNPLHRRDDFRRPALRHGSFNSLFQVAVCLPSWRENMS